MTTPQIMGIVNVTPDSFSDGGAYDPVAHALRLLDEGASMIDIGGESTRPGALDVTEAEEKARILPVIRDVLRARPDAYISVDTRRAAVASAAIEAGARIVNDVTAGSDPAMFGVCARANRLMVLMHMRGTPATMQKLATYDDVCEDVWTFLSERGQAAVRAGVPSVILDPGIGFAKTVEQNLALLRDLPRRRGLAVLVGASRKTFIGKITGQEIPSERLEGSLAVALHCMASGVGWVRVHDVAATRRAFAVAAAIAGNVP